MLKHKSIFNVYIPEMFFDKNTMSNFGRILNEDEFPFIKIKTIHFDSTDILAERVRLDLISKEGYSHYIIVMKVE